MLTLATDFTPCGDQAQAIDALVKGIQEKRKSQVLLGVTGSGKTFTMANVIARVQKPTLILAHNKTLAAQLYEEFLGFFPYNAVEYFVSYYDYYQPEAYIARTDTYIEKDMAINDRIDRLRLSATRSLLERDDVIIVSSVSCIYGLGMPEYYESMRYVLTVGDEPRRDEFLLRLVDMQYKRNDIDFSRGAFRVRGDVCEIFPAYEEKLALRIEFFGDEIERISEIDPLTGKVLQRRKSVTLYPGSHHVTPESVRGSAMDTIKAELEERLTFFEENKQLVEAQRLRERTNYDLEMIKEIGTCKGIENYSRHFGQREPGTPPPCLFNYFPDDYLLIVDESHQSMPQVRAMYKGDKGRKTSLIDFGFRLPSAYDNRPLTFEELYERINQVVYVSATPAPWEIEEAAGHVIEQILRPTGLLDPIIDVRPAKTQVDDCLAEIQAHTKKGGRVLLTTLTKKLSEELTDYLVDLGIKAKYLHSDIVTLERMQIIKALRSGEFDVLVGINLLREGLDIPEVSLVAILDADKEGFLRSKTSLIQTCGRAARNAEGRVIMYADRITESMRVTIETTQQRRKNQELYNKKHGITPQTIKRNISTVFSDFEENFYAIGVGATKKVSEEKAEYFTTEDLQKKIKECAKGMKQAAADLDFEEAARLRDSMRKFQDMLLLS